MTDLPWSVNSGLAVTVGGEFFLALYVTQFNFGSPQKYKISHFQIAINRIRAKYPNFVLTIFTI